MPTRNTELVSREYVPGAWHAGSLDVHNERFSCGARWRTAPGWGTQTSPEPIDGKRCAKCYPGEDLLTLLEGAGDS